MLCAVNGEIRHAKQSVPHTVQVPAIREVERAWAQIKKRLKPDEQVALLDRYLLTR